jgi:hypothetical protein
MFHMQINQNFVHQFGDQTRLYYDTRSTNHQELLVLFSQYFSFPLSLSFHQSSTPICSLMSYGSTVLATDSIVNNTCQN